MNLYWKRLFGGLMSTAKFEDKLQKELADYKRFLLIAESKELEEYNELYKQVKSSNFKELKRTLVSRKYKDTQEYRDMSKFNKLDKKSDLKVYFRVLESQELADYLAFKATPEFVSLANHDLVKKSPELTRLKKFEKSGEYKIYMRFHGSYVVKEYLELKEKVAHADFQKNNEFWSNPKRWETTKEYQEEKRFHQLADNDDIKFYLKHKIGDFKTVAGYELMFEDNFDWNSLNASKWDAGFHYKSPVFVGNHSFVNEQQANNGGDNVRVIAGNLHIVTKEQKVEALAWHPEKGFVQKEGVVDMIRVLREDSFDYYFIYSYQGFDFGVNRIYDIEPEERGTGGSWICKRGIDAELSVSTLLIMRDIMFEILELKFDCFDVRRGNKHVQKIHEMMGAKKVGETDLDFLYQLSKDDYLNKRNDIINLLNIKM